MDGTLLINESEEETVVRSSAPAPKKSRTLLWISLAVLFLFIGGAIVAGFVLYKISQRMETAQSNRQNSGSVSSSPATSSTPKATPTLVSTTSSPTSTASPQDDKAKPTPTDEDSEEITPIAWDTTASGFKSDAGLTYKFRCPPQGTEHIIWGSDVYTLDSSICTAAVHAGLFSLAAGGVVTVEFRPGRLTYGTTTRNGITSKTYGEYPKSYVVR
jgi:hypothetical protein